MEVTVPNLENFNRKHYHYSNLCYGMSLMALNNIMIKKSFYFRIVLSDLKNQPVCYHPL